MLRLLAPIGSDNAFKSQGKDNATSGRYPTSLSPDLCLDPHNVTLHTHTLPDYPPIPDIRVS